MHNIDGVLLLIFVDVGVIFLAKIWLQYWHFSETKIRAKIFGLYAYFSVFFFCNMEIRRALGVGSSLGEGIPIFAAFSLAYVFFREYMRSKAKKNLRQ